MTALDTFIDALPKVELHVHLVGSASLPTVLELARRHTGHHVPTDEEALRKFYEFRDFPHFAEVYFGVNGLVREPEDVAALVVGAARDLAAQNVRYVELTVTPFSHVVAMGMPMKAVTEALDVAARQVADRIEVAYVFDIPGEFGDEAARFTIDHALSQPPEAIVGFGIGGIEQDRAGHEEAIRDAFRAAIAAGLHSVPHAGEMSGPETIWEAIRGLGAERIGHGIRCVEDPDLMAYLRETQLPLEVCPTSNVCTRQVPSIEAHPLPRLIEEGLYATLNSDDPPMFGTTLTKEYRTAAVDLGLGAAGVADLARNTVRASFLDGDRKEAILAELDAVQAAHVTESAEAE
ncbi:adenosine deaminase [Actinoallomurus bryophytorum]|uniref:Adenosine deaminase/aminodeoxyfutalosine deaminase n=1 Tax=Actinoallomurus bryophytorum TaxID=1490222 RepID=A0A543CN21_9ACTN|nr:adenosine deaminase [Actinoallomurus bryophytorum]TQL98508.1 adenosine deaminase/aminodeoxyfutalosine deaminase [Actinoallomurus bryophytorum]